MDIYKCIRDSQKKLFNNSSTVHYGRYDYIYPYTSFHKDVLSNALNRYYKGYIKKNLVDICDNDDRVLEMIEKLHNKKALELLKKEKKREREKLLLEIEKENDGVISDINVNVANYKKKLKDKIFFPDSGANILYLLMELIVNRKKNAQKEKRNKRLNASYSTQRNEQLNKVEIQTSNNSMIYKNKNNILDLKFKRKDLVKFKNNTFRKDKIIKYQLSALRKSKSLSELKSSIQKNLSDKIIINADEKEKTDSIKNYKLNNFNEMVYPPLRKISSLNSITNKEKSNNISQDNLDENNLNENNEALMFKKKLEKNNVFSKFNFSIMKKINYTKKKKLENLRKRLDDINCELLNSIQNQRNDSKSFQKNKRKILLNLKKLNYKSKDLSQKISQSFRSENIRNSKEETKDKNSSSIGLAKGEKEDIEKYDECHIMYPIKSNYSLSQTNRHLFGAKKGIDAIDLFKQNLSSEIRKQFINNDKNLMNINMKKILKKFGNRYKSYK